MAQSRDYELEIVAFGAHPDDIEICCGGLMVKLSEKGYRTGVVDLTRGELGTGGDVKTREEESAKAGKILGLAERRNLALPDGAINPLSGVEHESGDSSSQLAKVVGVLRELRPEIVLIPYAKERHPDHVATHGLLVRALFFAGLRHFQATTKTRKYNPRQVLLYPTRYESTPAFVVDISAVHTKKIEAIRCYKSQLYREGMKEEEKTLLASPLATRAIDARDAYYGAMVGTEFGEPYFSQNALSLQDPIEYFRQNPNTHPFLYPGQH